MFDTALAYLRCPHSGGPLTLQQSTRENGEVVSGVLVSEATGDRYPIINGIPRFVEDSRYAASFGFQWQRYGSLQIDHLHGFSLSRDRFFLETGLQPLALKGMHVLDAGCGAGRFTAVALAAGARVFAFDLSDAVDANRAINRADPNLTLFQASLDRPPLAPESFDLVFCFGVLQHTPDPAASFRALVPFVKPGGRIAVDIYAAHPKQTLHWKYALRPLTKRVDRRRLVRVVEHAAPLLVPISRRARRIPRIGKACSRLIPIMVHDGFMGRVTTEEEVRMAALETVDALSPAYDRPRTRRALHRWFEKANLVGIETHTSMNALNFGWGSKLERSPHGVEREGGL